MNASHWPLYVNPACVADRPSLTAMCLGHARKAASQHTCSPGVLACRPPWPFNADGGQAQPWPT